jgi:acetyltransferase EpsM
MYLFGASGHSKVIIDIVNKSNLDTIEGIYDDEPSVDKIFDIPVFQTEMLDFFRNKSLIISIGNNKNRQNIANKIATNYLIAIHPNSNIARDVAIEEGTVIMAGAIINPDVSIGKHCIINTGSVVDHDCIISDFVHISPNATLAGNVYVGEGTHVGIGAVVIPKISIGKWVTIGAGAVIIKDVPDFAVVVGNPGKIIKYNSENE